MIEALGAMTCFVWATVSFMYGTRIAWVCGQKCSFKEKPEDKMQVIAEKIPAAAVVYFFSFLITFSYFINGPLTIVISSLTSAILLSAFVVSMVMPELKFRSTKN